MKGWAECKGPWRKGIILRETSDQRALSLRLEAEVKIFDRWLGIPSRGSSLCQRDGSRKVQEMVREMWAFPWDWTLELGRKGQWKGGAGEEPSMLCIQGVWFSSGGCGLSVYVCILQLTHPRKCAMCQMVYRFSWSIYMYFREDRRALNKSLFFPLPSLLSFSHPGLFSSSSQAHSCRAFALTALACLQYQILARFIPFLYKGPCSNVTFSERIP